MLPALDPQAPLADFQPPDDWQSPSPLVDYERGSLALNDPAGGLQQADWEGDLVGADYQLTRLPDGTPETVLSFTGTVSEARFTFDSAMRPHVAYVEDGVVKLSWWDAELPGYATLELPGATSPRLCLDDKRAGAVGRSVLLFYALDGVLYCRNDRTRFQTPYVVSRLPAAFLRLGRVGMSVDYRLQIEFLLEPGATNCLPEGTPVVYKAACYALYHGFTGPGTVSKASLSGIYHGFSGPGTVSKASLSGIYHGFSGPGTVSKASLYAIYHEVTLETAVSKSNLCAVLKGAHDQNATSKINLYAVINTLG